MPPVITTPDGLAELCERLRTAACVGLDTEFLRERTYRAELCLVQLALPEFAVCVDPLCLRDLSALAAMLVSPRTVKVLHASRQDLEVLIPIAGAVGPLFDTQIAAALTGLPRQIGYGELVHRLLGHELAKSHTRTDWSRRPLSAEQLDYAIDDVRYLLALKERLEEQLERSGRLAWLADELHSLEAAAQVAVRPDEAWQRIKGLRGLDPQRERLAQKLAAWRELRAIERNRPRGWILDDSLLREIVAQVPRSLEALAALEGMPAGLVRSCGPELIECIRCADVSDPPPARAGRARPDPQRLALVRQLAALNQAAADELGLSPELLATRRDLEQLADGRRDVPVLRGWRMDAVGTRLLAELG